MAPLVPTSASLPILTAPRLSALGFRHAFTTRVGGVSEPPYEALDFALLRDPDRLRENVRRLGEAVGFDPARLHQTRQVHGRAVVVADGAPEAMALREADALVAEPESGFAVAVRVADCVPVLLADPETGRVAAVHAGWRGVEAGVLAATVEQMGGAPKAFAAAIGPSIGPCCFEVGADVAARIVAVSNEEVVRRRAGEKAFVDLRSAVRTQLVALGLATENVDDVPGCTRCDAVRFYSYRRDGDASGRLVGVIAAR